MYGLKSSSLWRSTATYAVFASCGDGSMMLTVLHSGIFGVTFDQCWPSSVVTWTRPSSVPAQSVPLFIADSASATTVSYDSQEVMSWVSGPPLGCCLDLSFRVRSPLICVQLRPSSVDLKTDSPAVYNTSGLCGESISGETH